MEASENSEEDISQSNQDVYEIVKSLKQDNNFGVQQFYVSFKNKFPHLDIASKPKSLHTKADRVYSKAVALKRQKKTSQYEEFLKFDFQLPKEESNDQRALASASTEKEKKLVKELHEEKQTSKTLKCQIADLEKVVRKTLHLIMRGFSAIVLSSVFVILAASYVHGCAHIPQALLPAGYGQYSAYQLMYQSLHMAAAAACRGSTPTGGTGFLANAVLTMDPKAKETCSTVCRVRGGPYSKCDAQVSIHGYPGKAAHHGQVVGLYYNYGCNGHSGHTQGEASASYADIMKTGDYFAFCCCRKP